MPQSLAGMTRLLVSAALTACVMGGVRPRPVATECDADFRCQKVRDFFKRYRCPMERLALQFIRAADANGLDWRLLPAISMVETTGGKHAVKNNVFGWNSGKARFQSVEAGLEFVASRFAGSPIYEGRTAIGILKKFNPARNSYPPKVLRFMKELSAEPIR